MVEEKYRLLDLDLESKVYQLSFLWDTPTPPKLSHCRFFNIDDISGLTENTHRLRTITLGADLTGLKFFCCAGLIYGIHAHRAKDKRTALETYNKFPQPRRESLLWIFLPLQQREAIEEVWVRHSVTDFSYPHGIYSFVLFSTWYIPFLSSLPMLYQSTRRRRRLEANYYNLANITMLAMTSITPSNTLAARLLLSFIKNPHKEVRSCHLELLCPRSGARSVLKHLDLPRSHPLLSIPTGSTVQVHHWAMSKVSWLLMTVERLGRLVYEFYLLIVLDISKLLVNVDSTLIHIKSSPQLHSITSLSSRIAYRE